MKLNFLKNEFWYGGIVHTGHKMPAGKDDDLTLELVGGPYALDQYSPLFISSRGRILHSDRAFNIHFNKGTIEIDDRFNVELIEGFETLKGAQLEASRRYFSLSGNVPNLKFIRTPQYNTWIELLYNQNQRDILNYAHTLIEGGMAPGVLMIDEGWANDYGTYEFSREKFEDPKAMIDELHALGFSVMLWVTPIISPDSDCFRSLRGTDLLIREKDGKPAIREWWNGYSCVLDFTNPKAREWFKDKLHALMDKYGIDGFKFDSGDTYLYTKEALTYADASPEDQTRAFNLFSEEFEFNEFRNTWNLGGAPIVCRLQDKAPTWDTRGVNALIPNVLTQSLLGYFFGCPDMVGGGLAGAFTDPSFKVDEELYLRWLSASVLCPMMQFSISPKRILSNESFRSVQKLVAIRERYVDRIIELGRHASKSGEPIIRYMEYEYPSCGYEKITDQFMLGDSIIIAPILTEGTKERLVHIPSGAWRTFDGTVIEGGRAHTLTAELDELIILEKI